MFTLLITARRTNDIDPTANPPDSFRELVDTQSNIHPTYIVLEIICAGRGCKPRLAQ